VLVSSSESLLVWSQRGTRLSAEAGLDEHGLSVLVSSSESLLVWSQRGTWLRAETGLDEHGFSVLGEQ
jgi:hypothetical protein